MDRIHQVQIKDSWWSSLFVVLEFRVPENLGDFLNR